MFFVWIERQNQKNPHHDPFPFTELSNPQRIEWLYVDVTCPKIEPL